MGLFSGLTSPAVWANLRRNKNAGFKGNLKGEGYILGGVLVMGKGDQGVIKDFREEVWGDHAPVEEVLKACKEISNSEAKL